MRKLLAFVVAIVLFAAPSAFAQTEPPEGDEPAVTVPPVPTAPAEDEPEDPAEQPVVPGDTTDDDADGGLSTTAIVLIVGGALLLLLLIIFATSLGRRPGEPGPP